MVFENFGSTNDDAEPPPQQEAALATSGVLNEMTINTAMDTIYRFISFTISSYLP